MGLKVVKQTSEWRKGTSFKQMTEMTAKSFDFLEHVNKILRIEEGPYYLGKYDELKLMMAEGNKKALESSQHSVFTFEVKRIKGETK